MREELGMPALGSLTDEELVAMLRDGGHGSSSEIYTELFGRHYRRVASWCLKFTGERDAAADLAQEVLIKAYRKLDSFRGESRFSTWLYIVARNHCLAAAKKWSTEPIRLDDVAGPFLADDKAVSAHDRMERDQSMQILRRLLDEALSETENRVIRLHYFHELPLDAITRLLGLDNQSGAKAYIVSARRKLIAAVQPFRGRARLAATA